jgi:hypothetical protein
LDIDQAMRSVPELCFDRVQRRLWATLRFRLAMKLKLLGLASLHRRETYPKTERFLEAFKISATLRDTTKALKACTQLCRSELDGGSESEPSLPEMDKNATKLLLGVKETTEVDWHRQVADLVIMGGIVTASLERLLTIKDPDVRVYNMARALFLNVIASGGLLSQTPLEAAFAWTLSCRAAVDGKLQFSRHATFPIRCGHVLSRRFFPKVDTTDYNLAAVLPETIYYVQGVEAVDGLPTHPLADIFFRTSDDDVVLVDVTGGSKVEVKKKQTRLASWIAREQPKAPAKTTLYGVVLASLVEGDSNASNNVHVVRSRDARQLLGGLSQVFRWF